MSPLRIHHHFIPIKAWRIDCCKRQILSVQESAAKKETVSATNHKKHDTPPLNSRMTEPCCYATLAVSVTPAL